MKTRILLQASALSTLFLAAIGGAGHAQQTLDVEAGPFVGGTMILSSPSELAIARQQASPLVVREGRFEHTYTAGVTAGLRLADRFGIEALFAWAPTRLSAQDGLESHGGAVDVNLARYGVAFFYHLSSRERFQPFAGVGVGGETVSFSPHLAWQRQSGMTTNFFLGGNVPLTEALSLRLKASDSVRLQDRPRNHLMLTAGLNFRERLR